MTVKQLIEALQHCTPNTQVVVQKDCEGNAYSPLSNVSLGLYVADSTWSGERVETRGPGAKAAIFLVPTS